MPNLVGIGNSQVPTNAMLGGLAYQDPAHANLTSAEIENIAAIKAKTSDSANGIFVYDTRKDSDGGAWRKRCQHTSWYNEEPSAMRGHRKEFPALAIIVLELQQLFIYDGDDPNCSMWMRFDCSTAAWNSNATFLSVASGSGNGAKRCEALNAKLAVTGTYGIAIVDFINESQINRGRPGINAANPLVHKKSGSIVSRNDTTGQVISQLGTRVTVTDICNDLSMIVRPNAPIDETTGLPIPTIAVATNLGASIIQDNGFVVDKGTSGAAAYNITWMGPNRLAFNAPEYYGIFNDPLTHESSGYISQISASNYIHSNIVTHDWMNYPTLAFPIASGEVGLATIDHRTLASGHTTGLAIRQLSATSGVDDNSGMTVGINHEYNTGWMVGDVRGAYLAETDDTAHTGNVITNGSFATVSDGQDGHDNSDGTVDGWGKNGNSSLSINGNALRMTQTNSGSWQGGNAAYAMGSEFVVGKTYSVKYKIRSSGNGNYSQGVGARIQKGSSWHSSNTEFARDSSSDPGTSWTTGHWTWTATQTNYGIEFYNWYGVNNSWIEIDDVEVKEAVANRYYDVGDERLNKGGLYIEGTVTKTKVAEGSDLVYYSGFSANNYLIQKPDTRLDFGTGDFYVMYWVNFTKNDAYDNLMGRRYHDGSNFSGQGWYLEMGGNNNVTMKDGLSNASRAALDGDTIFNTWQHHCFMRKDSHGYSFRNGVMTSNFYNAWTTNLDNSNASFVIGRVAHGSGNASDSKLALVRIGAGAPTEEQVRKIYDDEKVLFEENAKCTLYGTNPACQKRIAYDDSTNILHAGTTAGRSEFSGLRRINNTTAAVTTAISASNELVVEQ